MIKGIQVIYISLTILNQPYTITALAGDIACDTLISFSMIYLLHRGRSGYANSNKVINTLIAYTINTCLLTTLCTVTCLVLFIAMPGNFIYAPFYFAVCRLYANSLLSTLNSRESIRGKLFSGENVINLSTFHGCGSTSTGAAATVSQDRRPDMKVSPSTQEASNEHMIPKVEVWIVLCVHEWVSECSGKHCKYQSTGPHVQLGLFM
jgi:hypothetical protein